MASPITPAPKLELSPIETRLCEVTELYLTLVRKIGSLEGEINRLFITDIAPIAGRILEQSMTKVINGTTVTHTREEFLTGLVDINQKTSRWTIEVADKITSEKTKEVILRLIILMGSSGAFTAMVILRFNENYKIFEINEVFSKIDGSDSLPKSNS